MKFFSLEQGKKLVKIARNSVLAFFDNREVKNTEFMDKRGVFVSIHNFPSKELRGCVGIVESDLSLSETVVSVARSAAFGDPRFFPLRKEELNKVVFEVSILTEPKLVKKDYLHNIKIGRDGLIVEGDNRKGLLLPQVAVDNKWDVKEFLEQICIKAGLSFDSFENRDCKVYRFKTQIFSEEKPNGEVVERG